MKLLVDLGNTRIKWASWEDGRLSASHSLEHRDKVLGILLSEAWAELPAPRQVHLASVVSADKQQQFEQWVREHWACGLIQHESPPSQLGLHNGYAEPRRLGIDRWLAMLGAWLSARQAACVVDCGSAVTIDILDEHGEHHGGWIVPGLYMMRSALRQGTALALPAGDAKAVLGRDTESAILNGTVQAVIGLIEQALTQLPSPARLVLTGGDAQVVARQLSRTYEIHPDLVLEGLAGVLKGA